jgi:tetrahydromethanopterin S-methyltransferase subunit C
MRNTAANPTMAAPSIEDTFVARLFLGLLVIAAMFAGGGALAQVLLALGVPFGDWIGAGVGALAVFLGFAVLYNRLFEAPETA